MKKKHITITGDLGSGKSSVAKELCKMLGYKYFSTGNIQRAMGKKTGLNTLELNYLSETNEDIDKFIDDQVIKINEAHDLYVLDSRLAWFFIRKSFKIYIKVDPIVAAKRVMSDNQRENEPIIEDVHAKSLNLIERRTVEDRRFLSKYGVDCSNMDNYDLIIDSTKSSVQEIAEKIIMNYEL